MPSFSLLLVLFGLGFAILGVVAPSKFRADRGGEIPNRFVLLGIGLFIAFCGVLFSGMPETNPAKAEDAQGGISSISNADTKHLYADMTNVTKEKGVIKVEMVEDSFYDAEKTIKSYVKDLHESGEQFQHIDFLISDHLIDKYGNKSNELELTLRVLSEDIQKINFENYDKVSVMALGWPSISYEATKFVKEDCIGSPAVTELYDRICSIPGAMLGEYKIGDDYYYFRDPRLPINHKEPEKEQVQEFQSTGDKANVQINFGVPSS